MKVPWSARAEADIREIADCIAADDRRAARRWTERVRGRARQVARFPKSGRVIPEVGDPSVRELIHSN